VPSPSPTAPLATPPADAGHVAAPVEVSVVIACYNAAAWIAEQLEALGRQRFDRPWEIIVVDNGSSDESAAIVDQFATRVPGLRVLRATAGRGPGYARNAGVRVARGTFVVFCDADDVVADDWVTEMAAALQEHRFVACRLEHERLNPTWLNRSRHGVQGDGLVRHPFLDAGGGGTLGVRRDLLLAVGGFDEDMRTHEDIDLCWRLQLAGTPLCFAPRAVIHYRYRPSLRGTFSQACHYGCDCMRLYRRYRELGHSVLIKTWRGLALECAVACLRLPTAVVSKTAFSFWLSNTGFRIGLLRGCLGPKLGGKNCLPALAA
jgi:glycosyltransferase involved in cell wall biosynthesis